MVKFGKNFLFGLLACVIFFALLELVLFAFGVDHRQRSLKLQNKYHPIANAPELPKSYQGRVSETIWHNVIHNELCYPDVEYIFKVKGNPSGEPIHGYQGINALGFRGEVFDFYEDAKGIMVMGNSCVFGWEIYELEKTFTYKLERKLNAGNGNYKVFNFGQPGYSSTQCLKLYKEWKYNANPDILVLYIGWNDIWPTPMLTDAQTIKALKVNNTWVARQLKKMRTYALMQEILPESSPMDTTSLSKTRVPLKETKANLEKLIKEQKTIIILPPYCKEERKGIEPYRKMLLEEFSEDVILLRLDSLEYTAPNSNSYFSNDGFHPNEKGAEYIADRLARQIAEM